MASAQYQGKAWTLLGAANLVFAAIGLIEAAFQVWTFRLFPAEVVGNPGSWIRDSNVIGQVVSFILLPWLGFGGLGLLKHKSWGIRISRLIFVIELIYIAAMLVAWRVDVGGFIASLQAFIVMNLGLTPQMLAGYPLIGLIVLERLGRRREGSGGLVAGAVINRV